MTSNKQLNALLKVLISIKEASKNEGKITKEEVKAYLQESIRNLNSIDDNTIEQFLSLIFKSADIVSLSSIKQYFRYNTVPYERNVSYSNDRNFNKLSYENKRNHDINITSCNNRIKTSTIYPSNAIELFSFEYPHKVSSSINLNKGNEKKSNISKGAPKHFSWRNNNNNNIHSIVSNLKKDYFLPNNLAYNNYEKKIFSQETKYKSKSFISMSDNRHSPQYDNEYIFRKRDYDLNDPYQKKQYYLSMKKEIADFSNKKAEAKLNYQSIKIFESIDSQLANLIQLHSSKEEDTTVKQE